MSSERLLDRNSYDKSTITMASIMSSYFVNIYYNNLFVEAEKNKRLGNITSVTEGYKNALQNMIDGFNSNEHCKTLIRGIHHIYNTYNGTSIMYSDFFNRLVKEFVPAPYFPSLTDTQKFMIIKKIIRDANYTIINKIISNFLSYIIDDRTKENADVLQDEMLNSLLIERELCYEKFVNEKTGTDDEKTHLIKKMQDEIAKLLKEKYSLIGVVEKMKQIVLKKNAEIDSLRESEATAISSAAAAREAAMVRQQPQYAQERAQSPSPAPPVNEEPAVSHMFSTAHVLDESSLTEVY